MKITSTTRRSATADSGRPRCDTRGSTHPKPNYARPRLRRRRVREPPIAAVLRACSHFGSATLRDPITTRGHTVPSFISAARGVSRRAYRQPLSAARERRGSPCHHRASGWHRRRLTLRDRISGAVPGAAARRRVRRSLFVSESPRLAAPGGASLLQFCSQGSRST
jgi:hypothetical protein